MSRWPSNMTIRPLTRPGTHTARDRSRFRAPWSQTLDLLNRELWALQAKTIVLELDFREQDLRLDGYPRANAQMGTPAVALSFDSKYGPLRYDADVFDDWQDNLRAIALGLEALRKVDRYGVTKRGEQYRGWRALPSTPSGESPLAVLRRYAGIIDNGAAPRISTRELYRAAAMRTHPDRGGDPDAFAEVQLARKNLEQAGEW